MLREAITEAMTTGKSKDEQIEARIKDVEKAVEAVKTELIAKLPKQKRAGRIVTKDLEIEFMPVGDEVLIPAAA
jgi:archaellum component FlaC